MKLLSTIKKTGTMGALIMEKDWCLTALGAPVEWPQSLKTALGIVLTSAFPMALHWGPDLLTFYNDALLPSVMRDGKHPLILGMPAQKAFPENWSRIKPLLQRALFKGQAILIEDQPFQVDHDGQLEEHFANVSYSPVNDESGLPAGVLVTINETTTRIHALRESKERENQLNFVIDAAELGTWDYNPLTGTFNANKRLKKWFGLPDKKDLPLESATAVILASDKDRVFDAIYRAIESESPEKFTVSFSIQHPKEAKVRVVRIAGRAYFADGEIVTRFNGTMEDITKEIESRKSLEESEANFRRVIQYSPLAMCVFHGSDFVIGVTNNKMLEIWGKTLKQVTGKPLFQAIPEAANQGFEKPLDKVYRCGERFMANQQPVQLLRNKQPRTLYVSFTYEPIKDIHGKVSYIIAVAKDVTDEVLLRKMLDAKKETMQKRMLQASVDAQEKEREIISNELHDNVNQLLASTKLYLGMIESEDKKTMQCAEKCVDFIDQSMREIRDLSHGLNPAVLHFIGLAKAIREMVNKINLSNRIKFSFDSAQFEKAPRVEREIELAMFRIIQAQVTNILKHSEAVRAAITLISQCDLLELTISDNGKGFDSVRTKKGLGLLNIENRTELLNGKVSLVSKPDQGCTLRVTIPVK